MHGFVEDLAPIVDRIDVCAIPLFIGAGIRVKVFELVGSGVPCIGTAVALQGLEWVKGCVEVEGREEWIERLVDAATDRLPLREIALRGATELRTHYSRARATEHLRAMMVDLGVSGSLGKAIGSEGDLA